ncbi:MAG: hypothetical protein KatS3mg003_2235 [Candidatus Nitrosocaldaceae archaeon]|nr:MAG: hypothetical protein KatS3mg003_2163 [Candidatus Nitrosocaldaceae archaeon]GIU72756.1 MAG: hypothetical protein KatS3mg003_2235 [Candidatus Nitrosocaldaceae archaeon]
MSQLKTIDIERDRLKIEVVVDNEYNSFLHLGAPKDPLSEKDQPVAKVDTIPIIPATSFKGALRYQLEWFFIENLDTLAKDFGIDNNNKDILRPCIPASEPTSAEMDLLGKYRRQFRKGNLVGNCFINIEQKEVVLPKSNNNKLGICPVCYFMGSQSMMGFLRIYNLKCISNDPIIDHTIIRIDRNTNIAAKASKADTEQVKWSTRFEGFIEIIKNDKKFVFGEPRKINNAPIDIWLDKWKNKENDLENRRCYLIDKILIPCIKNIKELGGHKSKGSGRVNVNAFKMS